MICSNLIYKGLAAQGLQDVGLPLDFRASLLKSSQVDSLRMKSPGYLLMFVIIPVAAQGLAAL